ncbi:MAG: hypothetical protein J5532_10290 [Lachnospiraceae bacterium]|nr:hypothetical protein [Lachnospiraceae bacterium]
MNSELLEGLKDEKRILERVIKRAERDLKRLPEGSLEVRMTKNKYRQFVHVTGANGKRVSVYITRKNRRLAEQLAQKEYNRKFIAVTGKLITALDKAIAALSRYCPDEVYHDLSSHRQDLVLPLIPTDEMFVEQWYNEHPAFQNTFPKTTAYTTIRGEIVRSKSEKMIADTYYTEQIPYVYEPKIRLSDGSVCYPDFAVLNISTRKTMFHEHFGMMDDEGYRQNTIRKIREYNKNGYAAGQQMLYTFEGESMPLDQEELSELIRDFLR